MGEIKLDTRVKVLVVDDFSTMRHIVRVLLRQLGYETIGEADDGRKALSMLDGGDYGLIISDWNMPGMEGIDLLKNVRAATNPALRDIPFIMVTAEADKEKIIRAIKAGVDNYVVKPFTQEVLHEKLEKVAAKKPRLAVC